MSIDKSTPKPWFVRTLMREGKVVDCFVAAKDVNGFPYDAEILADDEYRDDLERKLADCQLVSASHEMWEALRDLLDICHGGHLQVRPEASGAWHSAVEAGEAALAKAGVKNPGQSQSPQPPENS